MLMVSVAMFMIGLEALTDRSQFIIYDRERSDTKQIKCGVPRGSILGPILFIIYVNNIFNIFNVSNILYTILYVNDTCAVLSGNKLSDLIKLLHTELCKTLGCLLLILALICLVSALYEICL